MNTNNLTSATFSRRVDIDLAKATGILLVALGHFGGMVSEPPEWFVYAKQAVYTFHMPLFLNLMVRTRSANEQNTFLGAVRADSRRLLIPYILFALLFDSGFQIYYGGVWWKALLSPFYLAPARHATYLWFLPVLFILRLIIRISKQWGFSLFVILFLVRTGLLLPDYAHTMDTPFLFIGYLTYYGIFFFLGCDWAHNTLWRYMRFVAPILALLFAAGLWMRFSLILCQARSVLLGLLLAIVGSLMVWGWSMLWQKESIARALWAQVGKNSDIIYLLHPLLMYPFGWSVTKWNLPFGLMLSIALVVALIIPMAIVRKFGQTTIVRFFLGRKR